MSLTVGSLFSGIGGFDLAAERVGWEIKWQVEIDDYCTRVLEKHWPNVRRYRDVREHNKYEPVDVLCGGFPCQDISHAGRRAGIDGERSGLWSEFARMVREIRPRVVVVENSAALLSRGMGRILGDMADVGFDAEWSVLSACAMGAPHTRERVFIVAYPRQERGRSRIFDRGTPSLPWATDQFNRSAEESCRARLATWWKTEPSVGRLAYGVPNGVGQLGGYGNAVIPQVVEWIFRQIQAYEDSLKEWGLR